MEKLMIKNWISVKEKLPEITLDWVGPSTFLRRVKKGSEWVLAYSALDGESKIAMFFEHVCGSFFWMDKEKNYVEGVTHWMPIEEPENENTK